MRLFKVLPLTPFLLACLSFPAGATAQESKDSKVYTVGNGVKAPVALNPPMPAYTAEARDVGIEGIVLIQAIVRKDGTVDSFKILRGLGYGLDASAINTIATQWHFDPGTLNGEPVDVRATIEIAFRRRQRPDEIESLKPYTLRVQLVDTHWSQGASPGIKGSGYGNAWDAGIPHGFSFDCSCDRTLDPASSYPARWVRPDSRMEIALGFDATTGSQKTCELEVKMRNAVFTMRDGQPVATDPPH